MPYTKPQTYQPVVVHTPPPPPNYAPVVVTTTTPAPKLAVEAKGTYENRDKGYVLGAQVKFYLQPQFLFT